MGVSRRIGGSGCKVANERNEEVGRKRKRDGTRSNDEKWQWR